MSSGDSKNSESRTKLMDSHKCMLGFAILFLFLALFGALALSGAQTGSCYTSGLGSAIRSSTGGQEDGQPNPTAEVIAEFFIFLLLCIGVAMVTFIFTTKRAAGKLIDAGEPRAALIVDGKKDISKEAIDQAKKDQLMYSLKDLGLPSNVISAGMAKLKEMAAPKKSDSGSASTDKKKGKSSTKSGDSGDDDDDDDDDSK